MARHPKIQNAQRPNIPVVTVLDQLKYDGIRWLHLKHLQQQANKLARFGYAAAVSAADVLQFESPVNE